MPYLVEAWEALVGFWGYFIQMILTPSWTNYFYWLIGISLVVWGLEIIVPWRKQQKIIRKDFWLDGFYMFFNYFFFYMIGFAALSSLSENVFNDFLGLFGIENLLAIQLDKLPSWAQLLIYFVIVDFVHWNVHRLLHRVPWLWQFHKVHHSVEEMGFAAHLRFHWVESIVYKSFQYIPIALIGGFSLEHVFIVHIIQTTIGHLNHANIPLTYGPLKYLLNNPAMHIWHHSKEVAEGTYGVNFGLSLSLWDYLFGTAHIPSDGRDIPLGFENLERFPKDFFKQFIYPIGRKD